MERLPAEPAISLTEDQQKMLGCFACFDLQPAPPLNPFTIAKQCSKLSDRQAGRTIDALQENRLVTIDQDSPYPSLGRGRGKHPYHITSLGHRSLAPDRPDCTLSPLEKGPFATTTEHQRKVLGCLACVAHNNMSATVADISSCTKLPSQIVQARLQPFVETGTVMRLEGSEEQKRKSGSPHRYFIPPGYLSQAVTPPALCDKRTIEVRTAIHAMPAENAKMMRCVACLGHRIANGPLESFEMPKITACTGFDAARVHRFITKLIDEQIVEPLLPTTRPKRFVVTKSAAPLVENYASSVISSCDKPVAPFTYTNFDVIARCTACVWTRQQLNGDAPAITAAQISDCSGVPVRDLQHSMRQFSRLRFATPAESTGPGTKRAKIQYLPPKSFEPLPYKPKRCNQQLYDEECERQLFATMQSKILTMLRKELESSRGLAEYRREGGSSSWEWLGAYRHHKLLSFSEQLSLGAIIQSQEDPVEIEKAVETFVHHNVRLALWGVNRFHKNRYVSRFLTFNDALASCLAGIELAARKFDPERGVRFSTHATFFMRTMVNRHAWEEAGGVPAHIFALIPPIRHATFEFIEKHRREPTARELSDELGYKLQYVQRALEAHEAYALRVHLDAHIQDDSSSPELHEHVAAQDIPMENTSYGATFIRLMQYLTSEQKFILQKMILTDAVTVQEYAEEHHYTQQAVYTKMAQVRSLMQHPFFGILGAEIAGYEWQEDAQCFTERDDSVVTPRVQPSEDMVCERCPVNRQCYDLAANNPGKITAGIWGGVRFTRK